MGARNKFWKWNQPTWMTQNPDRIAWLAILTVATVFLLWFSIQQSHWSLTREPDTTNWPPGVQASEQAGVQVGQAVDGSN